MPTSSTYGLRWPRWMTAVLCVYIILALVYSVSTPIFEPPDEVTHFPVIDYIADKRRLPEQDLDHPGPWEQEGSQPPLYYLLSVPLVLPIDRNALADRQERNPHAQIGIGLAQDNHVSVLHDWDAEAFPWQRTALAVHVVRGFSILLSVGTIICVYHLARLALPGQSTLHRAAVLLTAFNPMFLFISASINNDNLINLLSTATMALLLFIWREGLAIRRLWTLALLLALAAIS
ncbi:MAG: hypothetical protein GYB65_00050, partial [Chloroflexi bacterium]|nr:hypothetical protein [Chloroflexota bacterium]